MQCDYYAKKQCLSCQWLAKPYTKQIEVKQHNLSDKLKSFHPELILSPVVSELFHFRNKAKMVVTGTVEKPILGIINHEQQGIDLCHCPLYERGIAETLELLKGFIKKNSLVPYNINKKKGELKFIILTVHQTKIMLRFVLRSENMVEQIRVVLPELQQLIPNLVVVSANIQPKHAAILEGEQEIILTENGVLPVMLNQIPLFIRPQSFFQTNTNVAEKLYQTANEWIDELNCSSQQVQSIWDLFCGVGGFGLHCTKPNMRLTGIEINQEAIACAKKSAEQLGLSHTDFRSLDSTAFALAQQDIPDLVLVNPPRRGIGKVLAEYLQQVAPKYILYSSCNPDSLGQDLLSLTNYQLNKVQLFDMFPHTEHMEVMVLLIKK
ncbi:23S rRNA (uracil(747)-C(5))-methyltransferase RlmC [Zophobihabitans entericus]|uniref:23S rRNA (uracil(747)-C(5))-methyltransferase RlmC n=1 Tax=Zophobihabitans entericus TaxID=1635327 RepID=UPI00389982E1